MSFRRHSHTPPPVYEHPPQYPATGAPSSSPRSPLGVLRPISPSSAHGLGPLSFDPLNSHSFDDFPPFPLLPPRSSATSNPSSRNQASTFFFPDEPLQDLSIPDDPTLSVFPASAAPKPRATRVRQKPAVSPPPDAEPDPVDDESIDFEILVHVISPQKQSAKKSKAKGPKPGPVKFGPIQANTDMDLNGLLEQLAEAVDSEIPFLAAASVEWRWLKPANSLFLPLRNDTGFKSLMNQIRNPPKNVSSRYIIIQMDAPVRKPQTQNLPWSRSEEKAGTSSAFNVDPDDGGFDDDEQPNKKATFDEGLEDEIDKLTERYPPGVCLVHPTIACFHNRVNDLHFELDRNKKIVWAAAIKKGTASLITAPVGSNFFKASAAIKKKTGGPSAGPSATALDAVAPLPTTATPTQSLPPQFPFYQTPYPFPPSIPGYPPFPPMGYPPSFPSYHPSPYGPPSHIHTWDQTPSRSSRSRRERSWDGSSPPREKRRRSERDRDPPSSPAVSGGSLDDFVERHPTLHVETKSFLDGLGFQIGDDLSVISPELWTAAGIPLFDSARIIKMYNKYKASLRSR
ncbi:hypothetical protein B0H12DRAFT_1330823 [Mycena haematopus]|nr:hypothetical protein B0H12DRAFT_1330823 [Mycena haematopus]